MKRFLTAAAFAAVAFLSGTATAADYDFDLNNQQDQGFASPIQLKVGDTARFVVDENPTTGFEWTYVSHGDRGVLESEAVYDVTIDEHRIHTFDSEVSTAEQEGLTGAGGTRVYELKAVQPGMDTFEIYNVRSWEIASADELETEHNGNFQLTIEVSA